MSHLNLYLKESRSKHYIVIDFYVTVSNFSVVDRLFVLRTGSSVKGPVRIHVGPNRSLTSDLKIRCLPTPTSGDTTTQPLGDKDSSKKLHLGSQSPPRIEVGSYRSLISELVIQGLPRKNFRHLTSSTWVQTEYCYPFEND